MDNIKVDLRWDGVEYISLVQYSDKWRALVNAIMNLLVP
jgi:hypothetical protein